MNNVISIYRNGHKQNCSICNRSFTTKKKQLLPQLLDNNLRKSLSEMPPSEIPNLYEEIENTLSLQCNDCKSKICSICGKVTGIENGHSSYVCNIIPSLLVYEILCELSLAHGWPIIEPEPQIKPSKSSSKSSTKSSSKSSNKSSSSSLFNSTPKSASGVGFAGSQSDNYQQVENAKKKEGEERTIVSQILKILSFFFPSDFSYQPHASLFSIVKESCLLKVMAMYFRNDWLMDTNAMDSDLYFSLLSIIRSLSQHQMMFGMLMIPLDEEDESKESSIFFYLQGLNKQTEFFMKKVETFGSQEGSQVTHVLGLSLDIQNLFSQLTDLSEIWKTSKISEYILFSDKSLKKMEEEEEASKKSRIGILKKKKKSSSSSSKKDKNESESDLLEKKYISAMKPLQFEFLNPFPSSLQNVHYLDNLLRAKQQSVSSPQVIIRISQELSSLAGSLPLSINSGVFMRVNEEKVNEIRFIIIGPAGTPYENGCFEFDMIIGCDYPNHPPHVQIMTTGGGSVRFNPNLYNNGKVCLSLLGTWSGPGWDPKVSTLLQVLVSIQSLIMVPDPYFNEPGYESSQGTYSGNRASESYNQNIRLRTMEQAMLAQLRKPTPGFEEVIKTHFYMKKKQIIKQCEVSFKI